MPDNRFLILIILFPVALACRAVTDLVAPPTPGQAPSPISPSPTLAPTIDMTDVYCSNLYSDILDTATSGPEPDNPGSDTGSDPEPIYLVTYTVRGDRISNPELESVPADFTDEQNDTAAHQRAWDYFTALIPIDERPMLAGFVILTDGPENILGAVGQFHEPDRWALELDISDASDAFNLTYTLLHEFGHLLTLNAEQVPPSLATFNFPGDEGRFDREAAACPQYFPGEGCSMPDSYINLFYGQFWPSIYDEWLEIDHEQDDDAYVEGLEKFYEKYEQDFVTDYAVTSPEEDIAESWSHFLLQPKPAGETLADQKMLFFYAYPDLVGLRDEIRGNLCEAFPR